MSAEKKSGARRPAVHAWVRSYETGSNRSAAYFKAHPAVHAWVRSYEEPERREMLSTRLFYEEARMLREVRP